MAMIDFRPTAQRHVVGVSRDDERRVSFSISPDHDEEHIVSANHEEENIIPANEEESIIAANHNEVNGVSPNQDAAYDESDMSPARNRG